MLTLVDWSLDLAALLASLLLAAHVLDLSARDVAALVACCAVYGAHEAWEAGLVAGGSHRAVEQAIVALLASG
ncbi:hypothetical protein DJ71_18510 [Halorubrum sp. E3]|nr:hypothetical protein DJ71_18510 [Halorubrum sp. E3]